MYAFLSNVVWGLNLHALDITYVTYTLCIKYASVKNILNNYGIVKDGTYKYKLV